MHNLDSQTVQLIIVAAVAVTMLLQAIALLAIFSALRNTAAEMRKDIEELRTSVVPVIESARELLAHTGPKIEAAIIDAAAIAHNLRRQTVDVQAAANEIIERMRRQSARADGMLTNLMDGVDKTAGFMTESVSKPMKQISGLLASAKAVIESLRTPMNEQPTQGSLPRGDRDHKL
jgi:ABC-type transporter Mla subunit MlaD